MVKAIHHDRMQQLFIRALASGAKRVSISAVRWELHSNCLEPFRQEFVARPRTDDGDPFRPHKWHVFEGSKMTMHLEVTTRCRRCAKCLMARQAEWRYRIREEVRLAARTWFGTLTLSPSEHYRVMVEARRLAASRSVPWESLSDEDRFKRLADASLIEVTRYIKRVRKQSKVPLRYIVVTERHKSGLPHFHMLVHEQELKPCPHRILSGQWHLGFEKWRLLPFDEPRRAEYLCKYLSKSLASRVRASQRYGNAPLQATVGAVVAGFREFQSNGLEEW